MNKLLLILVLGMILVAGCAGLGQPPAGDDGNGNTSEDGSSDTGDSTTADDSTTDSGNGGDSGDTDTGGDDTDTGGTDTIDTNPPPSADTTYSSTNSISPNTIINRNPENLILIQQDLRGYWNELDSWGNYALTPTLDTVRSYQTLNGSTLWYDKSQFDISQRTADDNEMSSITVIVWKYQTISDARLAYNERLKLPRQWGSPEDFPIGTAGSEFQTTKGGVNLCGYILTMRRNNFVVSLQGTGCSDDVKAELSEYLILIDERIQ